MSNSLGKHSLNSVLGFPLKHFLCELSFHDLYDNSPTFANELKQTEHHTHPTLVSYEMIRHEKTIYYFVYLSINF